MSVTVSKADGITVFTLTYDSHSAWPPLCQILKNLCCSPVCSTVSKYTVSKRLSGVQRDRQAVLGALQIMVGLLSVGLGVILSCAHYNFLGSVGCANFPYWSGTLFTVFGFKGLLSEKYPGPCLVNMILHLTGVGIAIAAVVLYTINITSLGFSIAINCETTAADYLENIFLEKCWEGRMLTMLLMKAINLLLIALSGLEVGVCVADPFLEIKALLEGPNESTDDPELSKALLEEPLHSLQPTHLDSV